MRNGDGEEMNRVLEHAHKKHGKFTILSVGDATGLWAEASRIREVLGLLVDNHVHHICVDLNAAPVIDSSVLGAIVEYHNRVSQFGGELVILNPHNMLLKAMMQTQLHRVLRFVESEAQL